MQSLRPSEPRILANCTPQYLNHSLFIMNCYLPCAWAWECVIPSCKAYIPPSQLMLVNSSFLSAYHEHKSSECIIYGEVVPHFPFFLRWWLLSDAVGDQHSANLERSSMQATRNEIPNENDQNGAVAVIKRSVLSLKVPDTLRTGKKSDV